MRIGLIDEARRHVDTHPYVPKTNKHQYTQYGKKRSI